MTSLRHTARKSPWLAIFVVSVVALTGCGHSAEQGSDRTSAARSSEPSSTSPAPAAAYDIARVDNVKNDFPPGFTTESEPVKTLAQQDIDNSGVAAFTGAQVDPPQCRALLIPPYAEPSPGARAAGVRATSDQGDMFVVALTLPQPVPIGAPPKGCDQFSITDDPESTGTAEAIPAPKIDGVTTTAVKVTVSDDEDPDYIFTAGLSDQTSVVAMGSVDEDLNPQQVLSDLLVKATAAVRGR